MINLTEGQSQQVARLHKLTGLRVTVDKKYGKTFWRFFAGNHQVKSSTKYKTALTWARGVEVGRKMGH